MNRLHLEAQTLQSFFASEGIGWTPKLVFPSEKVLDKVLKRSRYAMEKKELSKRGKWLSVRFQKELTKGVMAQMSIRYIDSQIGYGVFADEEVCLGGYIGEYTGVVRKRKRRSDRKNDYCFAYTIGDWVYNPFIIDAKEWGNTTRYMNHSADPNVESLSVYANGLMHIIFVALKAIKKGDQLLYHYGDTFWEKRLPNIKKLKD